MNQEYFSMKNLHLLNRRKRLGAGREGHGHIVSISDHVYQRKKYCAVSHHQVNNH